MMMEGIKALGGEGRVGVGEEDHLGDSMQCNDHAYRNNPGGICPFCLQEKLGKLVSSSFSLPIRSSSSSSPSSSFKSDIGNGGAGSSSSSPSLSVRPTLTKVIYDGGSKDGHYREYYRRRAPILFLAKKKKKVTTVASSDRAAKMVFKRSKYTTTPGRKQFSGADNGEHVSPRKSGGFWSFLYSSSSSSSSSTTTASSSSKSCASKSMDKSFRNGSKIKTLKAAEATNGSVGKHNKKRPGSSLGEKSDIAEDDDDDGSKSQATASASSFERKVWRSRSVGCGSRSFSGYLFERISAGFGDCTLRRVESQREGNSKVSASAEIRSGSSSGHQQKYCMKERMKCGGIFAGFMRI